MPPYSNLSRQGSHSVMPASQGLSATAAPGAPAMLPAAFPNGFANGEPAHCGGWEARAATCGFAPCAPATLHPSTMPPPPPRAPQLSVQLPAFGLPALQPLAQPNMQQPNTAPAGFCHPFSAPLLARARSQPVSASAASAMHNPSAGFEFEAPGGSVAACPPQQQQPPMPPQTSTATVQASLWQAKFTAHHAHVHCAKSHVFM